MIAAKSRQLRVVIPGGSGQVGTILARAFHEWGHEVIVLSRRPQAAPWQVAAWDARTSGAWCRAIHGADVVINLAGRSVNCRYSAANRRRILASRVESTQAVGTAIAQADQPPRVWLQASTATIYAHRHDAANDEITGLLGGSEPDAPASWQFSVAVATEWEAACTAAVTPHTRQLLLRSAMIMSPDRGGIFATLLGLVRLGLGGRAGDGTQFVSWIHATDFTRAVAWLIDHESLAGPVNLAAPAPLPNAAFMQTLRQAAGVPLGLPAPRWLLELGTALLRTESELVLKSRRVVPTCLVESGFGFQFPTWSAAATDLCRRGRTGPAPSGTAPLTASPGAR